MCVRNNNRYWFIAIIRRTRTYRQYPNNVIIKNDINIQTYENNLTFKHTCNTPWRSIKQPIRNVWNRVRFLSVRRIIWNTDDSTRSLIKDYLHIPNTWVVPDIWNHILPDTGYRHKGNPLSIVQSGRGGARWVTDTAFDATILPRVRPVADYFIINNWWIIVQADTPFDRV